MGPPPKVYILLHADPDTTTSVIAVYASLTDANNDCLGQARAAGVTLSSDSATMGPAQDTITPIEPVRWDTPEGVSCWVEEFVVLSQKALAPGQDHSLVSG